MDSPGWSYDAFCDALGGAAAQPLVPHDAVDRLFPRDRDSRFMLEAFWLKWRVFRAVVHRVLSRYERGAGPHLGLGPSVVRVTCPDAGEASPRFWNFTVSLDEQTAATPLTLPGAPAEVVTRLYAPPPERDPLFAAPVLGALTLGRTEAVTALILSSERIRDAEPGDAVRGLVEVHLVSEQLKYLSCSANDLFFVSVRAPGRPDANVDLWADQARPSARGVMVRGITAPLDAAQWKGFQREGQTVFSESSVRFYPTFHAPCDLYSLGLLLFRTLLVNDSQDPERVVRAAAAVAQGLGPMADGVGSGNRALLGKRLRERLGDESVAFGPSAVLFAKGDRAFATSRTFPEYVWYDALLLGFRLATNLADFSLCRDHGDYDPADPAGRVRQLLEAVDELERRIRAELFGAPQRDRELREACAMVKRELTAVGGA